MVSFTYGLSRKYESLSEKDPDMLYCLIDTHQIYRGDKLVAGANVKFITEYPTSASTEEGYLYVYRDQDTQTISLWTKYGDKIYRINTGSGGDPTWVGSTDLVGFYALTQEEYNHLNRKDEGTLYFITDAGKIYKGAQDMTSLVEVVTEFPETALAVSGKLYIKSIPSSDYVGEVKVFLGGSSWVEILPGYYTDGANWTSADPSKLATIGLIRSAIKSAVDSIKEYSADNEGHNVSITISKDHKVSADILLDPGPDNSIVYNKTSGFKVDMTNKLDKLVGAVENNIVSVGSSGEIRDSGIKVGGSSLSTLNDKTLATEKAVVDAISWTEIV